MNQNFNKGLLLTSLGSFWWGFIGVIYFEYVSFIGHIELVVHRCLWTAVHKHLCTTNSICPMKETYSKYITPINPHQNDPKDVSNKPLLKF